MALTNAATTRVVRSRIASVGSGWHLAQLVIGTALLVWAVRYMGESWLRLSAVMLLILFPAERLLAANPQRLLRRGIGNEITHWFVTNALFSVAYAAVAAGVVLGMRGASGSSVQVLVGRQPYVLQLVEAITLTYVCVYWAHRLAHTVPFLWRFHAVHHSATDVNFMTAARFHPVDLLLLRSVALVPLVGLGFTSTVWQGYIIFEAFQSVFVHANVKVPIGRLRWLIATPEFHRWHHADDPTVYDKNFCEMPLIDLLFGTAYMPAQGRPEKFGIRQKMPATYVGQMLKPLRLARRRRGVTAKR